MTALPLVPFSRPAICNQPWNTFFVPFDGRQTQPCCYGPHALGDLNKSSLAEIWNGVGFRASRAALLAGHGVNSCVQCVQGVRIINDHDTPYLEGLAAAAPTLGQRKQANYHRARENFLQGKVEVDHWPYMYYLDISSLCKIRCRKCYVYNHHHIQPPTGHMHRAVFERIIPHLPEAVRVICTGNGESVLHPDFLPMVEILAKNECWVSFTTSGNPLTVDMSRKLVDHRIMEIVFSIDSLDEKAYAYHHKGGKLSTVMQNVEAIRQRKLETGSNYPILMWFFVGMKSTLPELPRVIQRAAELGFQALYVERMAPADANMKQDYVDYYARENPVATASDRQWLRQILAEAETLAARCRLGFSTGYAAMLAREEAA